MRLKLLFITIIFFLSTNIFSIKVVVTAPNIAEMIAILGEENSIIGRTKECDFPKDLLQKKVIGEFGNVNFEEILKLNPDIVFTTGMEQKKITDDLNKIGIKTLSIYPNKIDDIYDGILTLGRFYNKEKFAKEWVEENKKDVTELSKTGDTKIYIEIYNEPIMTVSNNTYIAELIELAGAKNLFSDLPREYCRVASEDVVNANPDIIITTYPGMTKDQISQRMGWENISAIKNGKIFTVTDIDPDVIVRPGPRFILGIKAIQEIIK